MDNMIELAANLHAAMTCYEKGIKSPDYVRRRRGNAPVPARWVRLAKALVAEQDVAENEAIDRVVEGL